MKIYILNKPLSLDDRDIQRTVVVLAENDAQFKVQLLKQLIESKAHPLVILDWLELSETDQLKSFSTNLLDVMNPQIISGKDYL